MIPAIAASGAALVAVYEVPIDVTLATIQFALDVLVGAVPPATREWVCVVTREGVGVVPIADAGSLEAVGGAVDEEVFDAALLPPVEAEEAVQFADVAAGIAGYVGMRPVVGPVRGVAYVRYALVIPDRAGGWHAPGSQQAECEKQEDGRARDRNKHEKWL